jgi:hypothetical protein
MAEGSGKWLLAMVAVVGAKLFAATAPWVFRSTTPGSICRSRGIILPLAAGAGTDPIQR